MCSTLTSIFSPIPAQSDPQKSAIGLFCRDHIGGRTGSRTAAAKAQHPCHLWRRYRQTNISAYRTAGRLQDAEHRPHRPRRHDVHRLLRREQLYGGPLDVHHRPVALRTGLSKVGVPGAPVGLQKRDITIAQALKPLGYATGQFGKNHLGDRDEYLPTVHGFDEFFGNLYHLNAEEEPERPYWPKDDKDYAANNSPRGVLRAKATDVDDPTVQPHWGRVGKQTIEDTGPLTSKRMETIDDETTAAAIDFMGRQVQANKPFFVWMNTTRMHVFTHVRQSMRGQSGMPGNEYADGMIEHDGDVGKLLKASTISASPTTPSSSTPPITAPTSFPGPTPRRRRSAARRTPTGKAHSACRR